MLKQRTKRLPRQGSFCSLRRQRFPLVLRRTVPGQRSDLGECLSSFVSLTFRFPRRWLGAKVHFSHELRRTLTVYLDTWWSLRFAYRNTRDFVAPFPLKLRRSTRSTARRDCQESQGSVGPVPQLGRLSTAIRAGWEQPMVGAHPA